MDIFLANEQRVAFDEARLVELARHTLMEEDVDHSAELSLLFVGADHIRKLNDRFAGHDYATDVLAFPMMEDDDDGSLLLGDVIVCPEVAEKNAGAYGNDLGRELENLVVHGTLHLLGYDHQGDEDKQKMDSRTRQILSTFVHAPA